MTPSASTATPSLKLAQDQEWYVAAMARLVDAVQRLSHARSLDEISAIVRVAARELTGADGATFVLREGDTCHYAEENAISPLWKGKRFPMDTCISGWVMQHSTPAVIEDIYVDARIPIGAYRPTFVKSLVMVPIRTHSPIGAIGNYWAKHRTPTTEELSLLQALADTTSVALENVQLYNSLIDKVQALKSSNEELQRFAWVASHDLQEPLRTIGMQMDLLARRTGSTLDAEALGHVENAAESARRLQDLIESLLVHARVAKMNYRHDVDTWRLLEDLRTDLQFMIQDREATIEYGAMPSVSADPVLLRHLFQNLLTNAMKFTRLGVAPVVTVTCQQRGDSWLFAVQDNGIGIDRTYHEDIFQCFLRLHPQQEYSGSGIGLATCRKIAERHGGKIWVESTPGEGSVFYISLPHTPPALD